ncbi:MAG: YtxH domain-containing protein [Cyanobacteria bacterium P01_E01_bin.6]
MSDNRTGNSGALVGGFLLGAALGAVSGLLLAPKTGKETRRLLKKSADALPDIAEDLSTNVQLQADRLSTSALRNWDGTLIRLKDAIAAGIEASRQENRRLSKTAVSRTSEGIRDTTSSPSDTQ